MLNGRATALRRYANLIDSKAVGKVKVVLGVNVAV
jgi:hypothetical protein